MRAFRAQEQRALDKLGADTSPELVPGFVEVFVSEVRERTEAVGPRLAAGNVGAVGDLAHTLKRSASTFGAVRLQLPAKALEAACRDVAHERVRALAGTLPGVTDASLGALHTVVRDRRPPPDGDERDEA
jgi:HPt (histidine-containing phosphotransfer) domain-containing protein